MLSFIMKIYFFISAEQISVSLKSSTPIFFTQIQIQIDGEIIT